MKKLKKIEHLIKVWLKRLSGGNSISYPVGKYVINIPLSHTLPVFQCSHKLFDRFLPVLAKCLNKDEVIVDIGANVGDTAMMMLSETSAKIICIEPSEVYYSYLEKNIRSLPALQQQQISCIQAFVGTSFIDGKLKHSGGTAVVEESVDGNVDYKPLDKLLDDDAKVSLVKVDTDGFDFDVLLSAKDVIKRNMPILFWENQIDNLTQSKGYEELYDFLEDNDYEHIFIFDNFGNLMIDNADYTILKAINSYVYSMKSFQCTRTIFHTDILAVTDKDRDRVNQVIAAYKKEWIMK